MKYIFILLIYAYQYILNPLIGKNCRFYPSCSSYSLTALKTYGTLKGLRLAIARIIKCHPWHPGGYDPLE